MGARSGMVRLPEDDSGLAGELPDPWCELRAVSLAAAAPRKDIDSHAVSS